MTEPAVPVHVLDTDWTRSPAGVRSWGAILPSPKRCRWVSGSITSIDGGSISTGVIVVHESFLGSDLDTRKQLEHWAVENPEVTVVVISGQGRNSNALNLYYRKAPVGIPTDDHFSKLFGNFHSALAAGRRDFSLLEPGQVPDELLAAYLVCLATSGVEKQPPGWDDPFVKNLLQPDAWASARTQYQSGLPDAQKDGPMSGAWPQDIIENGKAKPGVVEALRSVLHDSYVSGRRP